MKKWATFIMLLSLSACTSQVQDEMPDQPGGSFDAWLIPSEEVFDGGPGKDGIPSIDEPKFISAEEAEFLSEDDLVVAVEHDGMIRIYPHLILDWHEIVNDRINDLSFALTYCPLTGTAINWNRNVDGSETTFGVSGLLYNSNLIPYDRKTDSHWSQIRMDCVNGEYQGKRIETLPIIEGKWELFKGLDNIRVLSTNTGYSRTYGNYPYGDYRTNHSNIIFPVSNTDQRKASKERVLGVFVNETPTIFSFDLFESDDFELLTTDVGNERLLILGSKRHQTLMAFSPDPERSYEPLQSAFPYVFKDDRGMKYDFFGRSESGDPSLNLPEQFIGFWFSWAAFYPDLDLYER